MPFRRFAALAFGLAACALVALPSTPVAAQGTSHEEVRGASPPSSQAAAEIAEPDPDEEDRGCGTSVQALGAELQKEADKGASKAGADVVSAYRQMRSACDDFRECKSDCRKDKASCKAGAKSEKHACIAECAKKSGAAKRSCRRACRRDKRGDVRDCRQDKRSCKDECRDDFLDDDCARGRRGFWQALGRAQQAAKGQRAKDTQAATKVVCTSLYAD